MSNSSSQKQRNRTIQDKFISSCNTLLYSITEPVKLKIARSKYEQLFKDPGENPLVSVYVPTYNRGQLVVDRVLKPVLAQTYENFELIVLGDCCTDNTEELVTAIDDPRIRFYNLPERTKRYPTHGEYAENHWLAGPVVAANTALSMVRGKWIARVDDSVIWTPDHIESLLRFAQQGDHEFVTGQCLEERFGKKEVAIGRHAKSAYFGLEEPTRQDEYNPILGPTPTFFYRSYLNIFKYNINCWRKSWNRVNDIDLLVRLFKAGVNFGHLEKVVCDMPPRPGEKSLGREAFDLTLDDKMEHYKF